tara:strand:- start:1052 stop:1633 length:582 start_codon:yes stop_codon:yes gene_type:complete
MKSEELRLEFFKENKNWKKFKNSMKASEFSALQSHQSYFGHLKREENKLSKKLSEVEDIKKKIKSYKKKLTQKRKDFDFLLSDFTFTCSLSRWVHPFSNNNVYYILQISRSRQKRRSVTLGSKKDIIESALKFYRNDKEVSAKLKKNFKNFLVLEFNKRDSKLRENLLKIILKGRGKLDTMTLNREVIFTKVK